MSIHTVWEGTPEVWNNFHAHTGVKKRKNKNPEVASRRISRLREFETLRKEESIFSIFFVCKRVLCPVTGGWIK